MTSIETEYRGYPIRYSENADEWNCYDVGYSHASLSKLKAKIDAMHLKLRKASSVTCLEIGRAYEGAGFTEASIIDYIGPKETRSWSKEPELTDHKVAAVATRGGNERPSRRETELSGFAPDTPEARAAIAAWVSADREVKAAEVRSKAARDAIPRLRLDDIAGLVKASKSKIEESAEQE